MSERIELGPMLCIQCGRPGTVFAFDQRSRGWLRLECPRGHFADVGADSVMLPKEIREKFEKLLHERGG